MINRHRIFGKRLALSSVERNERASVNSKKSAGRISSRVVFKQYSNNS